jgi:hypothetical protein|tara:strand:- start:258 stop:440 length:183 start_codon:yes stop_codon:yes gene_type:complete
MNLFQVVHKEINSKQDLLLAKLSSGSIKDHAEYNYVCGNISALRSISAYVTELESNFEDD